MSSKKYIRIPKGVPTAIAHNSALIKLADAFLMLKHLNQKGSGCIRGIETKATKAALASGMNMSLRTFYKRLEEICESGLGEIRHGNLYLVSYEEFEIYVGASGSGSHYIKAKPNVRLEYQLRALVWKESQQRQKQMIRKKIEDVYNCLEPTPQDVERYQTTEMEAIVAAFETRTDYWPAFDPDLGISQTTMAKWLTCLSSTSGHYWERRLEELGIIALQTNRKVESPSRARNCPLVNQGPYYSRPFKSTFLQLPNLVRCL